MRICIPPALAEPEQVTTTIRKEALAPAIELTIMVAPLMCSCLCTPWSRVQRFLLHVSSTGTCYAGRLKLKIAVRVRMSTTALSNRSLIMCAWLMWLSSSRPESPSNQWWLNGATLFRPLVVIVVVVYMMQRASCTVCVAITTCSTYAAMSFVYAYIRSNRTVVTN